MPKLQFTGTGAFDYYDDKPEGWHDGDIKEVTEDRAHELCEAWPDNFALIVDKKESKMVKGPKENKAQ